MFSLCRMFNSSTKVEFTTSSPFFANAMLAVCCFFLSNIKLINNKK